MDKTVDALLKLLVGAVLFLAAYVGFRWYFQSYDENFCTNVSPVHAVDYGCPVKG